MKLEICIIQPEKINSFDMEVIDILRQTGEAPETVWSEQLETKSFAVEADELSTFQQFRACIYEVMGDNFLKANIISSIQIECGDNMKVNRKTKLPALTMSPICQRFLDQQYTFDKVFWTPGEFKEFFNTMVAQMQSNGIKDDAAKIIQIEIMPKLFKDGVFVHFSFR